MTPLSSGLGFRCILFYNDNTKHLNLFESSTERILYNMGVRSEGST